MSVKTDEYIKLYTRNTEAIFVNGTKTTLDSGPYGAIHFISNGALSTIVSTYTAGTTKISSADTFEAGSVLYINATKIVCSTHGNMLIYKYK